MSMPTFGSSTDLFSPFQKMKIELEKAQKMEGRIIIINQTGQYIFYRNIFKWFKNFKNYLKQNNKIFISFL